MPVFQVDIQQTFAAIYTSNVYHIEASDIAQAATRGLAVAQVHRALLPTVFTIDAIRVSSLPADDGIFSSTPVNMPGLRSTGTQVLPQWNRFMINFNVGYTFLNRKFFLGVLEGDQVDGVVVDATRTFIQDNYIAPLISLGYVCSKDGTLYIFGAVSPYVAMRQLRRRKRRPVPIIS